MRNVLTFAILSFLSLTAAAQSTHEDDTAAALFVRQVLRATPYYDSLRHITITHAVANPEKNTVRLTLRLDADRQIQPQKEHYIPFLTAATAPWDLALLAHHDYALCLQVNSDRTINNYYGHAGLMVIISNEDLRQACRTVYARKSRQYLVRYAEATTSQLPLPMGKDEWLAECHYDDSIFSMTLEYSDSIWATVRQFLESHLDNLRIRRAQALVDDTTNAIATSAALSNTVVLHRYRNHSRTDSVEYAIAPTLLQHLLSRTDPTPTEYLQTAARQFDQQTPLQVDTHTRLAHCAYDTAARMMTFSYTISESAMLNLENRSSDDALRSSLHRWLASDDVAELAKNLVAARASLRFSYLSAHSRQPIVITFSPDDIDQVRTQ